MRPKKRRAKRGFALLEAMVFVLLMLLFSAAMLATTYNAHKRALQRTQNNRAYSAAVSALKMIGDDIAANGTASKYYSMARTGSTGYGYAMWVQPEGTAAGELGSSYAAINLNVDSANFTLQPNGSKIKAFTATATVLDETETVTMLLQEIDQEAYPHTLYGAGFAGRITNTGLSLTLGPDTDLYLYGYADGETVELSGFSAGGNVIVPNASLELTDSSVRGSLVGGSASTLTLKNTLVGDGADAAKRLSNVYSTGRVELVEGAQVNGDVYAGEVYASGRVDMAGSIYHNTRTLDQQVVLDKDGSAHYTTETEYARRGTVTFAGGGAWKALPIGTLEDPLASAVPVFEPNFPVNMPTERVDTRQEATPAAPAQDGFLYKVADGAVLTLNGAPAAADGSPAIFVELGSGSTLILQNDTHFALCVYGAGPDSGSTVKIPGGSTLTGSLQGVALDVTGAADPSLTINHVQPASVQFQAPSSAGFAQTTYIPLEFKRQTAG